MTSNNVGKMVALCQHCKEKPASQETRWKLTGHLPFTEFWCNDCTADAHAGLAVPDRMKA